MSESSKLPAAKILVVDLNNFAAYPTLAIGYLVASLRKSGMEVEVLCPLSHDVPAHVREHVEGRWDQFQRRMYFSTHPALEWLKRAARAARSWWITRPHPRVLQEVEKVLQNQKVDVVLLSAYLNHYPSCLEIGKLAAKRDVPVLLGGPAFNLDAVTESWLGMPGICAIIGGEMDRALPDLVRDVIAGRDLLQHAGVFLPDGRRSETPKPLQDLGSLPVPDFRDFPWDRYRERVVPVMAGRGCSWAQCKFCADVVTANGRTFRTRPVERLFQELEELSELHASRNFILLDIKLNSDVHLWRGLIEQFQERIPGGSWVGTVHVDQRPDNGLSPQDLQAAREAGLVRVTFGAESGSQRILDCMDKGCTVERNAAFLRNAHEAGISVRCTMMIGYPGETADDLEQSLRFLDDNGECLDRVRLSQFKPIPATRFAREYERSPDSFPALEDFRWQYRSASGSYRQPAATSRSYRQAKGRVLARVHDINRQPLRAGAQAFDGLL